MLWVIKDMLFRLMPHDLRLRPRGRKLCAYLMRDGIHGGGSSVHTFRFGGYDEDNAAHGAYQLRIDADRSRFVKRGTFARRNRQHVRDAVSLSRWEAP